MDKYTISILAIKGWQEIWAKNYNDLHLRITFEYLIKSELLWLNQDFKQFIAKQDAEWIGQEEVWKHLVCQNPIGHSRLLPILKSKSLPISAEKSRRTCRMRSLDLDVDLDPSNVVFQTSQKEVEDLKLETEETHLELDQMRLKLKDRETQLKSANEFLESLTSERVHEREYDQLKISKLTQELKEERRSRNLEKAVIEELHEQTSALELRLDQVKHESEQLRLNILEKDKIIDGKAAITTTEILEQKEQDYEDNTNKVPELATIGINTDFVLDDESQENSYVTELLDVIRELNIQVQSKDEQLESVREELRSRSLWNKGDLHIIAEEEPESPPLNYELDMAAALAASATSEVHQLTSCQTGSASVSADLSSNNAKSPTNDLESQERRTRIALLENQQAELETEIRLLKQCETGEKINQHLTVNLDEQNLDRRSSGCGDSLESNPELDALSRMVVDKVLEKIKSDPKGIPAKIGHGPANGEEKSGMAVTQMRYLLQRERNLVSELQAAISTERLKALEWMEKHNREKETLRELQAELCDMHDQMDNLHAQHLKDQDEIDQLALLYKAEQSQSNILEKALATEKDNFHRLKVTLDTERIRSREAIDRDNETILDLRTALEVERERWRTSSQNGQYLMPSASTGNIPRQFRSLQETANVNGSRKYLHVQMPNDEINLMRGTIDQIKEELHEERSRVDALKACLEQEREKYEQLSASIEQPQSITISEKGEKLNGLDQEVVVFYTRKLETEELQKIQLQNQLDRATDRIARLESDNEFLRTQIKMQDAPNANFEKFYIQELEKKLEAHRSHEVKLTQEFQFAQKLVKDLQHENAEFLSREKELVNQVERLTDQNLPMAITDDQTESSTESAKVKNLLAINEALQGKIRLLENRIGRLQDDLQDTVNLSQAGGGGNGSGTENVALMIRQHKKAKPTTKLRLWRLERQRKCLVWQKRYLQAVLQSMDHEGNAAGHSPCKNNSSCCNCTTSSSEGQSMSFEKQENNQESRKKPTTKFRAVAYVVIAALRIQGSAENWKKMVARVSKSVTPVSE